LEPFNRDGGLRHGQTTIGDDMSRDVDRILRPQAARHSAIAARNNQEGRSSQKESGQG